MNSLYRLLLTVALISPGAARGQITGYTENFQDGTLSGWVSDHPRTFTLSTEDGSLRIAYTRTASSDQWDNFNWTLPAPVQVSKNPIVTLKIKSTLAASFSLKPLYSAGDNFLTKTINGDNIWHSLTFNLTPSGDKSIQKFYLYLDGGTTAPKAGTVWIDDIKIGDSVNVASTLDYAWLSKAVLAGEALLASTQEGNQEGQFPAGSQAVLQAAVTAAKQVITAGAQSQTELDQAIWALYDACSVYESSVSFPEGTLTDKKATRETRYLYQNLQQLQTKSVLFGMHDATGYGVGWSDDNDRSDVKSVTGDYPAVYSEDMSGTDGFPQDAGKKYRQESAYARGGVITMCWHQVDPQGRGFYSSDVGNENVVKTILPGGTFHSFYKDRLKKVALYFKSLRGPHGENIPVIFRPYHEHTGNWFWWGDTQCSPAEYAELWQFTVGYLTDSLNVHNLLWAISPSSTNLYSGTGYERIYPGHDYVDIIGGDYYFSSPASGDDKANYLKFLQTLGREALQTGKVGAVTEVGQETLKNADWFTQYLLPPLKADSLASQLVYAAVWRNASTTHHYAPYPGHPSAPDFVSFFNDPYTLFESDLPKLYQKPVQDQTAPVFTDADPVQFTSSTVLAEVKAVTNEKAFLRWSELSQPFDDMPGKFTTGEGQFTHSVFIEGVQGQEKTLYIQARDLFGNTTTEPLKVTFLVDTLTAPVYWSDPLYPSGTWQQGTAVLGSGSSAATKINPVKTAYFRRVVPLASIPSELAVFIKAVGGVVMYLNGKEVIRYNLPAGGRPGYAEEPTASAVFTKSFTLDAASRSNLKAGENWFSFEVHAMGTGSVEQFDARIFTASSVLVPYLSAGWLFSDAGEMPPVKLLGEVVSVTEPNGIPSVLTVHPSFPNPFNPATTLRFSLPAAQEVTVAVYNLLGAKVATVFSGNLPAGLHALPFSAGGLASGVYLVRYQTEGKTLSQKIILLK